MATSAPKAKSKSIPKPTAKKAISAIAFGGEEIAESVVDLAAKAGMVLETLSFNYLTDQQNLFLRSYLTNGRKPVEAYRTAYSSSRMNDNSMNVEAHRRMNHPGILMALAAIERQAQAKLVLTLEGHLIRLAELSREAQKVRQFAAAINAEVARGKAAGLYVTKTEITGKDGGPISFIDQTQLAKLSNDELDTFRELMLKLSPPEGAKPGVTLQ